MLSGPIKRAAVPALAVRAVSNNTGDGMRKIANDVTSLTQVRILISSPCVTDMRIEVLGNMVLSLPSKAFSV